MTRIFRIIISIGILGVSLMGAVFLVWPEYQEYASLKAQIQTREARLESAEKVLAQLKKVQEEAALHEEDFAKIDVAIPKDAGLPVLYEHIQQLGASSGLVLLSLGGEPPKGLPGEVGVIVFTAEFSGSYDGLKNFLDAAKKSARIFNVSTLDVSADGQSSGELHIEIELFAYEAPLQL
ncbi:MAG TPA: type 4a pilus biogenesis protein PilO [Candidatus Paceibacterota bacterium]